jgi:hypothetical protein
MVIEITVEAEQVLAEVQEEEEADSQPEEAEVDMIDSVVTEVTITIEAVEIDTETMMEDITITEEATDMVTKMEVTITTVTDIIETKKMVVTSKKILTLKRTSKDNLK